MRGQLFQKLLKQVTMDISKSELVYMVSFTGIILTVSRDNILLDNQLSGILSNEIGNDNNG